VGLEPLVERWDGGSWSIQLPPPPLRPGAVTVLTGVSCTAPTTCTAVGRFYSTIGWSAARWDGTSWTTYTPPSPLAPALTGVSCASPTSCIAVGNHGANGGPTALLAETWDGSRWSVPATPSPTGASNLAGVSCASATACTAVGSAGGATLVEHWNGIDWSVQPSPAAASVTSSSVSLAAGKALLTGTGVTGFLDTSVYFQYAPVNDPFCASGAETGTPSSTPTQLIAGASTPFAASSALADLTLGSTYCFRLIAANSLGTSYGPMESFPFSFVAPEVSGLSVITTGARTATVTGLVYPALQATSVEVDYNLRFSSFCTNRILGEASNRTTSVMLPADQLGHSLSLPLTGLLPGDRYCAAIVARNESGVTSTPLSTFAAGVPVAQPGEVTAIGGTAATVTATIDPVAQRTMYGVAYGTARSTWCRSHGARGAAAFATKRRMLRFRDLGYHSVTVPVRGLLPGLGYCLALVARNGSGTTVAGVPWRLPVAPRLTVSVLRSSGSAGGGSVTSAPNGISCPGRCSASFPRGIPVTLLARPATGWILVAWNPSICQSYGCPPPPPCSTSVVPTCVITPSGDTTVTTEFGTWSGGRPSCVLTPDRPKVQNLTLSFSATCTAAVGIAITGNLKEVPAKGTPKTIALRPIRPTGSRASWQLIVKLPRSPVTALRAGATESVTLTLTYSNKYGKGRITATIHHLTA
jgi:hypothetical protein